MMTSTYGHVVPTIESALYTFNHKIPSITYKSIVFSRFEGVYLPSMADKEKTNSTISWEHVCTREEYEEVLHGIYL